MSRLTRELADYEKVKRIGLLAEEFSIDGGELTPTLKVKRRVVEEKYGQLIESLYSDWRLITLATPLSLLPSSRNVLNSLHAVDAC